MLQLRLQYLQQDQRPHPGVHRQLQQILGRTGTEEVLQALVDRRRVDAASCGVDWACPVGLMRLRLLLSWFTSIWGLSAMVCVCVCAPDVLHCQ